jgi:citrate synthase
MGRLGVVEHEVEVLVGSDEATGDLEAVLEKNADPLLHHPVEEVRRRSWHGGPTRVAPISFPERDPARLCPEGRRSGGLGPQDKWGPRLAPAFMSDPGAPEKGLEHVVMGDSAITLVAGETGGLAYRGFDVGELVGHASYEAVLHLLLHGDPPTPAEESALRAELVRRRVLGSALESVADALPVDLAPMEALRTLISAMGTPAFGYPPTMEQGLDLVAKAPSLLTRFVRRSRGEAALAAREELGHVANYLYLLSGRVPDPARARAL